MMFDVENLFPRQFIGAIIDGDKEEDLH